MDKKEALRILVTNELCKSSTYICEECPAWKHECHAPTLEETEQALKIMLDYVRGEK